MKGYPKKDYLIATGLILLCIVPIIGGIVRLLSIASGGPVTPENERFLVAPTPAVIHIIASIIFGLLGAFQFVPTFRNKNKKWHRIAGIILVTMGLVSGLTGLWLTVFYPHVPTDGDYLYSIRIIVGIAMVICIVLGFIAIRRKQFYKHSDWMIRAYAIGMGAGTQVFTHLPWFIFVGEPTGLPRDLMMGAGWGINLVVAEWIIRRDK